MSKGVRLHQTIPQSVYNILTDSAQKRGLTPSQLLILLITSYAPPVRNHPEVQTEEQKAALAATLNDLDFEE